MERGRSNEVTLKAGHIIDQLGKWENFRYMLKDGQVEFVFEVTRVGEISDSMQFPYKMTDPYGKKVYLTEETLGRAVDAILECDGLSQGVDDFEQHWRATEFYPVSSTPAVGVWASSQTALPEGDDDVQPPGGSTLRQRLGRLFKGWRVLGRQ